MIIEHCHVTLGFFQTKNKSRNAMALQLNDLLAKYGLNAHIVA
jgi:hypothetical protein